jgi:hypothetical protein
MSVSPLTTEFAARLAPIFKAKEFRKTGATWHRDADRLVQVFNIQKSQWGDQFYLNVGIYLRDLGNESRPTEYRCHVRCRAEGLLGDGEFPDLRKCLDFDSSLDRDQRYARLQQIVAERVLPWLDENKTLESLGTRLRNSTKGFAIVRGVPELLGFDMNRHRFVPDVGR